MLITLQKGIVVEVIPGTSLAWSPAWSLSGISLRTSSARTMEDHELQSLDTVGSGTWYFDAYDEYKFNNKSLSLHSLWFHVPEVNYDLSAYIAKWQSVDPIVSSLQLLQPEHWWQNPTELRWFAPNGDYLACLSSDKLLGDERLTRIRVATNLDLLIANDVLFGWMLSNPIRHLPECADCNSEETKLVGLPLLNECLALVEMNNIEAMENQSERIRVRLISLHSRARSISNNNCIGKLIVDWLRDILLNFYSLRI